MWAFSSKIFPAQGVLFCPNFVPKGKLTMKKTFYWKVFKILSKKQQTSMPDLFDWHVLILPENYKIITVTKWLKQKNCKKDAGIPPLCMYSFIIHSSIQCPSQQKNKEKMSMHCTARPVSSNAKDILIDTLCQFVSILAHSVFLCCSTMVTNSNLQDFVYFTLVIAQCFICLNWNMLGQAPQIASAHEKITEDCLTNILTTIKEAYCSLRTDLVSSGTFRSPSSSSACTSLQ